MRERESLTIHCGFHQLHLSLEPDELTQKKTPCRQRRTNLLVDLLIALAVDQKKQRGTRFGMSNY